MKWCLATSLRTDRYVVNVIGTPCIFRRTKGNMKNITGIMKLRMGDDILITETVCRKSGDSFRYLK
jgi:hypothetical protein